MKGNYTAPSSLPPAHLPSPASPPTSHLHTSCHEHSSLCLGLCFSPTQDISSKEDGAHRWEHSKHFMPWVGTKTSLTRKEGVSTPACPTLSPGWDRGTCSQWLSGARSVWRGWLPAQPGMGKVGLSGPAWS